MNQPSHEPRLRPSVPEGAASPAGAPSPTASEIVTRPEPGLARGRWEAPAWVLWAIVALVLVATALYALRRLGLFKLRSDQSADGAGLAPASRRRPHSVPPST